MRDGMVVAAVDGAECSGPVLAAAMVMAQTQGLSLRGLFVVDGGWADFIGNDWQSAKGARQGFLDHIRIEQEEQARLARIQFEMATANLTAAEFVVAGGDPIGELLRCAKDPAVALLALSRRSFAVSGRPSLRAMAERLAKAATRPLLLLP